MPKRRKPEAPGVPEWVVTFGDMMSLLLCFFILLAAFSELKKEHQYQRVITAVKEAFGYSGGVGVMPTDDPPLQSMIELLETIASKSMKDRKVSQSQDRGVKGKQTKVSKVHEGMQFTIGGNMTFEPASAELKEEAKTELLRIAQLLQGRNNKISIRGHAARQRLPEGSPYADLRDLSYYRAKAVSTFLIEEAGMREDQLIVDARADSEPLELQRYDAESQAENRRVEIIMTEALVSDYNPNHDYGDASVAQGDS